MNHERSFPYAQPHIDEEDRQAVVNVLTSSQLTRGPQVEAFESAIAAYCGAPYAVAFSSGTAAMHAAYFAAEVGPYDHILTSPISYVGTITGAILRGAQIHFADIDPASGNCLPEAFPHVKCTRGRPIYTVVHYRGATVDMASLERSIRTLDAVVIEDAAHAFGATYHNGKKVGSCCHSDMTVFSFHPVKSITCAEGGMVLTADRKRADLLRQFRSNGVRKLAEAPWLYTVEFASGNFHMSEMHAALGCSQLNKLDAFLAKRKQLVAHYRTALADLPHLTLLEGDSAPFSSHHLMVVLIDFSSLQQGSTRIDVMRALQEAGIGTQVHYIPLYYHPVVKTASRTTDCPCAEQFYAQALSLPLYYDLTTDHVEHICNVLRQVLRVS